MSRRFVDNLSIGATHADAAAMATGRVLLALAMIGLGIRGLVAGDFALIWQHVPEHVPGRAAIACACAMLELATGAGLLVKRTAAVASGILCVYLLLWALLLKLPPVLAVPQFEANWSGLGEIIIMLTGAWLVFASQSGEWAKRHPAFAVGANGIRHARLLFILALPMVGLAHFVYLEPTAGFVPAWLPWHEAWACLTGAGDIAAALGLLFALWPRLAATLEAAMLSAITLLVWLAGVVAAPTDMFQWTGFLISTAIACSAWVVADSYRTLPWLAVQNRGQSALSTESAL